MARPREYDDDLRARLLETAGRLLAEEGPKAVSTRRIAAEVGTSTNAIYTLIGSKDELNRQMYLEGFRRLDRHLTEVPRTDDALHDLRALAEAYFDNALENPSLYRVMFSLMAPEFSPTEDDIDFTLSTLQINIDAVQRCVDDGLFTADAEDVAVELWAVLHGFAMLAVGGMLGPAQARRLRHHTAETMLAGLMAADATMARNPTPTAHHALNIRASSPSTA